MSEENQDALGGEDHFDQTEGAILGESTFKTNRDPTSDGRRDSTRLGTSAPS